MTLLVGAEDEGGGATDEGLLGDVGDEDVAATALAGRRVVDGVADELVDRERLAGDGRLVGREDRVALVDALVVLGLEVALALLGLLDDGAGARAVLVVVLGKDLRRQRDSAAESTHAAVGRNGHAVLDDDNVAGNDLASLDVVLLTVTEDDGAEGDAGLELGDDVAGLLLLVVADEGCDVSGLGQVPAHR